MSGLIHFASVNNRVRHVAAAMLCIGFTQIHTARAQPGCSIPQPIAEVSFADQLDGFEIVGDLLYAWRSSGDLYSITSELHTLDISDPANPQPVAVHPIAGKVQTVHADGATLFVFYDTYFWDWDVTATEAHVELLDVTSAASPVSLGEVSGLSNGFTTIEGDLLCSAIGRGARVFDLSDPLDPVQVAEVTTQAHTGYGREFDSVVLRDSWLYIASAREGLEIFDLSDPSSPVPMDDSIDGYISFISGGKTSIVLDGDFAFHVNGTRLRVIDFSDPLNMSVVALYENDAGYTGIERHGQHILLQSGDAGYSILDITSPTSPSLVAQGWTPNSVVDFGFTPGGLALADSDSTITLYDTEGIGVAPIEIVKSISTQPLGEGLTIDGDTAYTSHGSLGYSVFDITDGSAPSLVANVVTGTYVGGMQVRNGIAFIASFGFGLQIYDVSDPFAPVLLGVTLTTHSAPDIEIAGGLAFVSVYQSGMGIVDISDPALPVELSFVPPASGGTKAGAIDQGTLYTINNESSMQIVDVTDPASPSVLSVMQLPDEFFQSDIIAHADVVYISGLGGVLVVDVSDPMSPVAAGFLELNNSVRGMHIDGDHLFVAGMDEGVHVLNIADALSPTLIKTLRTNTDARDVEVRGGFGFSSNRSSFQAFEIASACQTCPADVNADGVLDNGDIGAFVALFLAGDLIADFTGDGILDNGDIGAFVAAFLAGC